MSITSDEVNFLVYRYLQESGFVHSAFTFAYESQVAKSNVVTSDVPPGALISFLQKGLQYISIEAHVNEDGTEKECVAEVSLVSPHTCRLAQTATKELSKTGKRKRKSNEASLGNAEEQKDAFARKDVVINGNENTDDVTILSGHKAEVFLCAWNPCDNTLASGSGDSTARLWDIPDGFVAGGIVGKSAKILKHNNENGENDVNKDVTTIEWNIDGTLLASGSYDGQGRIWDKEGNLKQTLNCHEGPMFSLKWNKQSNLLLSGSFDKTAIVWDPTTGKVKQQFDVHSAPTLDVDWKDNEIFATCSTDKKIQVCKIGKQSPMKTFEGHTDEVNTIKWNPSGTILASGSDDHTVKIWDLNKDNYVYDFREHTKEIYTIKWSPTGPSTDNPNKNLYLASASFDSTIKIWDAEVGKCLYTLQHMDPVYSVAFSPNGDYLASGALKGALHIWSMKDGQVVKTYSGSGDIFEVEWNYRGDLVAACFSDNILTIANFRS